MLLLQKDLAKDTEIHPVQKELNKLQEQLKNAESTIAEALAELENAHRTVQDLSQKLKTTSESKESAIKATQAATIRQDDLKKQTVSTLLSHMANATKHAAAAAKVGVKGNTERACEISKEIFGVESTVEQAMQASIKAQQEEAEIFSEDIQR
ncbi:hypothetical protein Nepgr_027326 [Nepenthes gracilis]|uniref:Uncharacterized protein n=1 Tax=Nepenthes gracilis TaxID=150966 RepID=A0AAD3Y1D1_NEPGR|nr:hypothetical protein Nepgr_027326 [Nepenthes gracilis]